MNIAEHHRAADPPLRDLGGLLGEAARHGRSLVPKGAQPRPLCRLEGERAACAPRPSLVRDLCRADDRACRLCQPARSGRRFGEIEQFLAQIAAGEYLNQIAGGMPMNQAEYARPWRARHRPQRKSLKLRSDGRLWRTDGAWQYAGRPRPPRRTHAGHAGESLTFGDCGPRPGAGRDAPDHAPLRRGQGRAPCA